MAGSSASRSASLRSSYPAKRPNTDWRHCPTRVWRPFAPVRVSVRMSPAVSLRPRASSSSREASRPPPDVTLEPWNSSFRRGSNVTRRAAVSSSPAAPSISSPLQPRGRGRAGKTFEVVAPLQKRHYAPGTPPVSDFHQLLRRPGKVRLGELKISQRIAPVGVKPGRDEDEVRPERLNARQDGNVERLTEDVTTVARPQRRVHNRIVLAPFGSRP